jgi:hypothetical protein
MTFLMTGRELEVHESEITTCRHLHFLSFSMLWCSGHPCSHHILSIIFIDSYGTFAIVECCLLCMGKSSSAVGSDAMIYCKFLTWECQQEKITTPFKVPMLKMFELARRCFFMSLP